MPRVRRNGRKTGRRRRKKKKQQTLATKVVVSAAARIFISSTEALLPAAAVLAMASDPALAMTLGNAGRAYVATHFNRESLANRYADVLAGAIAEKQLAPR